MEQKRKYYIDYVNHMVYFFLSCPGGITVHDHRGTDVQNWLAVQAVWSGLNDDDKAFIQSVFGTHDEQIRIGQVRTYANDSGRKESELWKVLNIFTRDCARARGLI